ncbi:MAG: Lrp/AsnC family transcriptional regulator, partial [Roseibium sp.]
EAGLIRGYRTLLDEKQLGYDVTAFAMVGLHSQTEADLMAFEETVKSWTIVRESYMLSGEVDFLLKCVSPDLQTFQNFVIRELTAAQNVDSVRTALTIRRTKDEPIVPIEED